MHVKLKHWNLPHPNNSIPNFLGENHKTRTNNLHHQKAGSVGCFEPEGWDPTYTKGVQYLCYNMVAVELTLYLARPPRVKYADIPAQEQGVQQPTNTQHPKYRAILIFKSM